MPGTGIQLASVSSVLEATLIDACLQAACQPGCLAACLPGLPLTSSSGRCLTVTLTVGAAATLSELLIRTPLLLTLPTAAIEQYVATCMYNSYLHTKYADRSQQACNYADR